MSDDTRDDAVAGGGAEGEDPLVPGDAARLAREAMERARQAARQRGATRSSAKRGRQQREQARRATEPYTNGRDPQPMGDAVASLLRRMGWTEQIEVSSVTGRRRDPTGRNDPG